MLCTIAACTFLLLTFLYPKLIRRYKHKMDFIKQMSYIQFATFTIWVLKLYIQDSLSEEVECDPRHFVEVGVMILRLFSLAALQATLFIEINKEVKVFKRGRVYGIIIGITNLQKSVIPLIINQYIKFTYGNDNNQEFGLTTNRTFEIFSLLFSFMVIGTIQRMSQES